MGIQINGNNDIISALDGSWTAEGANIYSTGIVTATTFKGNIVGTAATFTGPVTIGGTLTYEDVTNIDSVGIITARGDIHVGENIAHIGDTDTKIVLTNNNIDLQTGGSSRISASNYGVFVQTGLGLGFLASSGPSPAIKSGGTNNQDLLLTTGSGNPTRLQISAAGKVGIGSAVPRGTIDVWGDGSAAPILRLGTEEYQTEGEDIRFGRTDIGANDIRYHSITSFHDATGSANYLKFKVHDGGSSPFQSQSTCLTLRGNGNVGIGTEIPGAEFEVRGAGTVALFQGTGGNAFIGLTDVDAGAGIGYIGSDGGALLFQTPGSSYSTKLQITSSGQVLIGETSVAGGSQKLVIGQGGAENFEFTPGVSAQNGGVLEYIHRGDGATRPDLSMYVAGGAFKVYTNGNYERFRITTDGDMGLGANNPGADPAVGNDATVFEIRQTTTGNITSGNNRRGAVLRLKHEAQWENGYQSNSPNDDLGRVEFVTGDTSVGEGKRAIIRCRNLQYYNHHALTFEVATANSTSVPEVMRLESGRVMIAGATDNTNAHANADDLIIGNTGSDQRTGITIVSDTDKDGAIHFSDGAGAGQLRGQIVYGHTWGSYSDILGIYTAGSKSLLIQDDGDVILGEIGGTTYTEGSTEAQLRVVGDASASRPGAISLMGFGNTTNAAHARINFQQQTTGTNGQTTARIEAINRSGAEDASDLVFYTEKTGDSLKKNLELTHKGCALFHKNRTGEGTATNLSFDSLYLGIGENEGGINVYRTIGFGYRSNATSEYPASIGCQITDWASHTKAELVFATRNTTGQADVAVERIRIDSTGRLIVGASTNTIVNAFKVAIKETSGENAAMVFLDTDNMKGGICGIAKGTDQLITGTTNVDFVVGSSYADTHIITGNGSNSTGYIRATFDTSGHLWNNNVRTFRWGGYISCAATVSVNLPYSSQGNIYHIKCMFSHYNQGYGAYRVSDLWVYSGHSGIQQETVRESHDSGNGGSWTITRGGSSSDPIVVAKSAGSYTGYGHWWIEATAGWQ